MSKDVGSRRAARAAATERAAKMRAQQAAADRRRSALLWGSVGLVVLLVAGGIFWAVTSRDSAPAEARGVLRSYQADRGHIKTPQKYAQTPPAGGAHSDIWLNCGVYPTPVPNENAVHAMEHGAVWVTYDPSVAKEDVTNFVATIPDTFMVVSPYSGMDAPVVASAWGKQMKFDKLTDPKLAKFITDFRLGPQTPELGAACVGGTDGSQGAVFAP